MGQIGAEKKTNGCVERNNTQKKRKNQSLSVAKGSCSLGTNGRRWIYFFLTTAAQNLSHVCTGFSFYLCTWKRLPKRSLLLQGRAKPDPLAKNVDRTHYQSKTQNHFVEIDLHETDLFKMLRYKFFCSFAAGLSSIWNTGI